MSALRGPNKTAIVVFRVLHNTFDIMQVPFPFFFALCAGFMSKNHAQGFMWIFKTNFGSNYTENMVISSNGSEKTSSNLMHNSPLYCHQQKLHT